MNLLTEQEILKELAKRKYEHYVKYTNGDFYTHGKFTRFLCNTVQDFIERDTGNAFDILILSVAPQHGKTETITRALPSWYMGKHPDHKTLLISYEADFAEDFLASNRKKLVDNGSDLFGIQLKRNNNKQITNSLGGYIKSFGIKTGISGRPAHFMLIDDPIKNAEDSKSPKIRAKVWLEWIMSMKVRLQPHAKVVLIMTRWHQEDLAGMLMLQEKNVTVLNFPIECETDTDVMGRVKGEMLCPEIGRTREWWDDFKYSFQFKEGAQAVNALYYGRPSNSEGGIFQRKWFEDNYYTKTPKFAYMVISLDATFKDSAEADFVSIQVWSKLDQHYHLWHKVKDRMGFHDTLKEMVKVIRMFGMYNAILVEDKANGSAIIETLRKRFRSVVAIEPYGSKISRANAISPIAEAGCIHIKEEHSSVVNEAVDFPNSDHDDEVDCMDQAINYMKNIVAKLPEPKEEGYRSYDDDINAVLDYQG